MTYPIRTCEALVFRYVTVLRDKVVDVISRSLSLIKKRIVLECSCHFLIKAHV